MVRKRYLSLVILFLLYACNCSDEGIVIPYFDFVVHSPGLQEMGSASADVFDKTWLATAYIFPSAQNTQHLSIRFETYSPEGFLRDELFFGNFALKEGAYSVVYNSSAGVLQDDNIIYGGYGQYQDDGDVLIGGYELDHQYNNNFFIDRIDTTAHVIEGRFNALFKIREEYTHENIAQLILFENGRFMVNF